MRRNGRTDSNQQEITRAMRQIGACVQPLHSVGGGCPDLLIGYRGRNILLEIKNGSKAPSARELNAAQREWHAKWGGQVCVVESVEAAVERVIQEVIR